MSNKLKNLIFILAGLALILVYVLFFKKDNTKDQALTVNTNNNIGTAEINKVEANPIDEKLSSEILATLSSIKSITLEDKIFTSNAFQSLVDGTVPLVKDGNEGRPNPFAPIGNDALSSTAIATPTQEAPELNANPITTPTNTTNTTNTNNTSQNKKPN